MSWRASQPFVGCRNSNQLQPETKTKSVSAPWMLGKNETTLPETRNKTRWNMDKTTQKTPPFTWPFSHPHHKFVPRATLVAILTHFALSWKSQIFAAVNLFCLVCRVSKLAKMFILGHLDIWQPFVGNFFDFTHVRYFPLANSCPRKRSPQTTHPAGSRHPGIWKKFLGTHLHGQNPGGFMPCCFVPDRFHLILNPCRVVTKRSYISLRCVFRRWQSFTGRIPGHFLTLHRNDGGRHCRTVRPFCPGNRSKPTASRFWFAGTRSKSVLWLLLRRRNSCFKFHWAKGSGWHVGLSAHRQGPLSSKNERWVWQNCVLDTLHVHVCILLWQETFTQRHN